MSVAEKIEGLVATDFDVGAPDVSARQVLCTEYNLLGSRASLGDQPDEETSSVAS